ncbi:hypothetical protein GCK72_010595 [Caenorhabditis remanei]|uniref:40S ribosomal protein S12 n=3 Tax=Caenorhabditis TaxID=6237 RepID=E3LYY5_CAERE|nr:hypothetical protein GCK72_010595 [Caenorhabditis remanei]EFO86757.1 CRE-RPS-12 protein [Caenorhabditis remanei]KAF1762333.1 hypothetical protein GCK72_010595 [Caenorhabditis remanei]
MSDAGGDVQVAPAAIAQGPMDKEQALRAVLRAAHHADGLAKGLHETCKALDKREAHFCVLAENCDEPQYVKLVETLCAEHQIPLIKVADKKIIGEYCGLCKYDKEGKARKVVGCSSAVVTNWGNEEQGRAILTDYFNSKN